jgi:hypothetical protein
MEYIIYRLLQGKPKSFQLPLADTFVKKFVEENGQKKDLGYRRITYVPGTDTFFKEDIKGDLQPQSIWFENGELRVRKDDKLLNEIMQVHPWFNRKYKIWSPELEQEEQLSILREQSEARQLVEDTDFDQIQAVALAVFGKEAIGWSEGLCELKLRQYADVSPKELKLKFEASNYQSKLLAGLAFTKGIVKENFTRTAVVWSDSEGVIIKLGKGENGILELGRWLNTKTEESELVLQSIGERVDAKLTSSSSKSNVDSIISQKDREIAELKKQLAQKATQTNNDDDDLENAKSEYKAKFGKEVPVNKKNDLEWIIDKINSED